MIGDIMDMDIVFLCGGAREKALRYLLDSGESVVAVITPWLTSNNNRFEKVIQVAVEFGVKVIPVKKNEITTLLKSLNYQILLSCGFPYIIEQDAINTAKYAINSHPTLLPKYRGFRSGPFIIINGEKYSGVTVHYLTSEMDRGEIIAQERFEISPFDTTKSLFRKCQELEPKLIYSVLQQIKQGQVHSYPQDESQASTYVHVRSPVDSKIDWEKPLKELYNEIRACDPVDYPAYFFVEGQKVCIKLWRADKMGKEEDLI